MRARVGDGDGDAARSLLNLAMITPGNSPTLWTALVDYGADSDEEALLSDMCARGNASAVRYLLARTEEPTTAGDSRRVLRVSFDQMRKAIRSGSDLTGEGDDGADTMMMHTPLQEATARGRWEMAAALVAFMNEDDVSEAEASTSGELDNSSRPALETARIAASNSSAREGFLEYLCTAAI
ncbi:hypothetical protein CYMTET_2923 [Cymbomonas tetramitiformis]|uniref:Uncharacterized protein n=1 Tax=Cymbomonas tetramitiformis TaxID=36881 RepID=A0AAE0LLI6_9CHLO|nr:hypothetical protein CYMTET_2923 [Cymbomonas tetramitiformis]